jgi:hypothetical protein
MSSVVKMLRSHESIFEPICSSMTEIAGSAKSDFRNRSAVADVAENTNARPEVQRTKFSHSPFECFPINKLNFCLVWSVHRLPLQILSSHWEQHHFETK